MVICVHILIRVEDELTRNKSTRKCTTKKNENRSHETLNFKFLREACPWIPFEPRAYAALSNLLLQNSGSSPGNNNLTSYNSPTRFSVRKAPITQSYMNCTYFSDNKLPWSHSCSCRRTESFVLRDIFLRYDRNYPGKLKIQNVF